METTEIAVNQKTGEIVTAGSFTPEQTQLLKRVVGKDFSDDEFLVFLNVCKKVQLDPFSKQIYALKFAGRMTVMTGIDGLRLVADRTGNYAPGRAPTFTYDKDHKLESATAYVRKRVGSEWFEVAATAFYSEYHNPINRLWEKLPHALLEKCAEAKALRRAFPNETSGLYTNDEMDQAKQSERPTIKPPKEKTIEVPKGGVIVENSPLPMAQDAVAEEIDFGNPPTESEIKEKVISEKQIKLLFAKWKSKGLSEEVVRAKMMMDFNKKHSTELTSEELTKLLKWIDTV